MKHSAHEILSLRALAERWWAMVARGVAAILFGVLALTVPNVTLLALVMMWGAYAFADGALGLAMAFQGRDDGRRWGWLLFEGLVGVGAGVCTLVWPGVSAATLIAVMAVWALATGVAKIGGALLLRDQLTGEWRLAASGVASLLFGVAVLARPAAGALAALWLIGGYAILIGGLFIALGLRLRAWELEQATPAGAAPAWGG